MVHPGYSLNKSIEGTLWSTNSLLLKMAVKMAVDLPLQDGDFPVRYVSLPEGIHDISIVSSCFQSLSQCPPERQPQKRR